MSRKRLTKQAMRDDQFRDALETMVFGALENIEAHLKTYIVILIVLVIAIVGTLTTLRIRKQHRAQGSYLLSRVMEVYNAPIDQAKQAKKTRALSFQSEARRSRALKEDVARVVSSSWAGESARIGLVYKVLDEAGAGKLKEALKSLGPLTKDDKIGPLALMLRARLYESSGQWKKAEGDWKALAAGSHPSLTKSEALWQLGRFYERWNKPAEAVKAYKMVAAAEPGHEAGPGPGGLGKRAKQRIKALKGVV